MGVIEHSVWIGAAPDVVWRVYTDPRRIPEWETGGPVVEILSGDGADPGSSYTSRRGRLMARTTVVEADPPRGLLTHTDAYFGLRFDVASSLAPEGGGTRLGIRAHTLWPRGLGVVGRAIERVVLSGREAAKELARLKALIESEATA
jgi:uncharacterized protein YndB with AHSA1/START domain